MLGFASRRLLAALPLAWGVATLVFLIASLVPGRPFHETEGPATDPRAVAHLRELFGTERPLAERYARWLGDIVTGDLGTSFSHRRPVADVLEEGLRNTFVLALLALVLQFVLGAVAGILASARKGSWVDRTIVAGASVLYATPSFCLGIALVGLFAVGLGWLPASQMRSIDAAHLSSWPRLVDALRHLLLPALTLALPTASGIALYVREQMLALSCEPFLTAARSRGVSRAGVLLVHAFRNALLPVVSLLGLSIPGLAGGAAVVEVLYAWPGMGRLAYQAVLARDEPLVLGCTLVAALGVVLGSLVADLAAAALDPRVT